MKKSLTYILILIIFQAFTTQAQVHKQWESGVKQEEIYEQVYDSAIDGAGNIYTVGTFSKGYFSGNTLLFASVGEFDIYMTKFDPNGNLLWAKRMGEEEDSRETISFFGAYLEVQKEKITGIEIVGNNIYLTGAFYEKINFSNPYVSGANELISAGEYDAFLAKFDTDGNFQWAKRAGGIDDDYANGICVSGNSIYLTGGFTLTANFNTPSSNSSNTLINSNLAPQPHPFGGDLLSFYNRDTFIAKFTDNGSLIWAKRAGSEFMDYGKDIDFNETGIYILGSFDRKMNFSEDFSPSEDELVTRISPQTELDIYLVKYDFDGNYLWARRAGSGGYDFPHRIIVNNNSIFITGNAGFRTIDFNTPISETQNTLLTNDSYEPFLAKFTDLGTFQWAKRFAAQDYGGLEGAYDVKLAKYNNDIFVCGISGEDETILNFSSPYVAGVNEITLSSASDREAYVAKYNGIDGSLMWAKRAGGGQLSASITGGFSDPGHYYKNYSSIAIKSNGAVVITGPFGGNTNFNTPSNPLSNVLISPKTGNVFLAQFANSGAFQWAKKHTDVVAGKNANYQRNIAKKCVTDYLGNMYVVGNFNGALLKGNQFLEAENNDIYLIKYDKYGVVQWVRRAGGSDVSYSADIVLYGDGVYITGNFRGTINFNTPSSAGSNEITSAGETDIFIAKYSGSGAFAWAKRAGGTGYDDGNGITASFYGVYVTGSFNGTANFNTPSSNSSNTVVSAGMADIFIAEFDAGTGALEWVKRAGGTGGESGISISADNTSLYVVGGFGSDIMNFNSPSNPATNTLSTTHINAYVGFLAKFTALGAYQWSRRFGHNEADGYAQGRAVIAKNDNIYIGGAYAIEMTFSQSTYSEDLISAVPYFVDEGFLAKYNSSGTIQWFKRSGGTIEDIDFSEDDLSIYTAGKFLIDGVNFNTPANPYSNGLYVPDELRSQYYIYAGYFAKYGINGNYIWSKQTKNTLSITNIGDEIGSGISVQGSRIYIAAYADTNYDDFQYCFFDGAITTNALSGSSFCAGSNISVPFTTSTIFDAGNTFKVELSNSNGIFPAKNGHIGAGTISPIVSTLPSNKSGTNFKVRVVSTNPIVIGSATPALLGGFQISAPSDGGTATGGTTVCTGTNSTTLTLTGKVGNVLKWQQAGHPSFSSFVVDINSTSNSIVVANQTSTTFFRALVQNGSCASDYSISTPIVVSPATVAGSLSSVNGIFCSGTNDNTINLTGKTGSVLKWQSSPTSSFTSPIDISNTSTSLNIVNINSSTFYRAVVKSGACAESNTSGRQISVSSGAITFPNTFPLNNITYPVKSNFTITGQNLVSGNSNVLYRSNKAVELKPGFRAENGTIFKAEIGICN